MSQEPLDGFRKKMTATSEATSPSKSPVTFDVSHAGPMVLAIAASDRTLEVGMGDGDGLILGPTAGTGCQAGSPADVGSPLSSRTFDPSARITYRCIESELPPAAKTIRDPPGDQAGSTSSR